MRYLITIVIAALSLNAFGQVPDYVPTEGLVAWYPLDSSADDESINSFNLCTNSVFYTDGRYGDAGGAFLSTYGSDLLSACSPSGSWTDEISYALWFQPFDLVSDPYPSGWFALITMDGWNYDSFGTLISDFGEECDAGSHRVRPSWPNNQSFANCSEIETGQWHHLCVSGNEDSSKVFLNGDLILTSLHSAETNFANVPFEWTVGASARGHTYQFKGAIDEVGIWDVQLAPEEVLQLYNAPQPILGCLDVDACNYSIDANVDDGSCLDCSLFAERCGPGTIWDSDMQMCIGDGSGDINLDGCVQLNDLLDLLSAYGDCGAEESPWQCGDLVPHEGYDYSTVLIGDQCWFSENCRYLPEVSPSGDGSETEPYYYVYGYEGTDVASAMSTSNYATYGVLYNWPAVMTEGICPSGWHIPSDEEWQTMEISLGMSEAEAAAPGVRGTDEGYQMKSYSGWYSGGNGSNSSGFTGLPGGYCGLFGFLKNGNQGHWWSSSENGSSSWSRELQYNSVNVTRLNDGRRIGFSARCVRD